MDKLVCNVHSEDELILIGISRKHGSCVQFIGTINLRLKPDDAPNSVKLTAKGPGYDYEHRIPCEPTPGDSGGE